VIVPAFSLEDATGACRIYPTGRPCVLFVFRDDCPTCQLTFPVLDALNDRFGQEADVWAISQTEVKDDVRDALGDVPILNDTQLLVSYRMGIETVPTVYFLDPMGWEVKSFVGFGREDWRQISASLQEMSGLEGPQIEWSGYPDSRPGCGSRTLDPGVSERLAAEAEGRGVGAREIEIADGEDVFEFLYAHGFTDGLPVIPPTRDRVELMLKGTRRNRYEVVANVPPNMAPVTVEKVAANAVMAGCRPEYLPIITAALEAACTAEFNVHGVLVTTWGAAPIMVVNGPIRTQVGMNSGMSALGSGTRANATIGRAFKLTLQNVGGARPGEIERSTLGAAGKFGVCIAEWEERSPWEPMHVERGFAPDESVVTLFGLEAGSHQICDQTSRTAYALGGSLGLGAECGMHPNMHGLSEMLLVLSPEHSDTISRDGWTKDDLRARMQKVTSRPLRDLMANDEVGDGTPARWFGIENQTEEDLDRQVPKFRTPKNINIVVAGGTAGKFSSVFGPWMGGKVGSVSVSRKIEEV
jgi:hypothetical protein